MNVAPAFSAAALALAELGSRAEAMELAQRELQEAVAFGATRRHGMALSACGLLDPGPEGLALLDEAVRVLEGSAARLEHARALVNLGAIPPEMFNAANTEHFALYAKMRPFLNEVRAATNYPDYLLNVERVIMSLPDAEARIAIFERYMERQRKFAAEGKQRAYLSGPMDGDAN